MFESALKMPLASVFKFIHSFEEFRAKFYSAFALNMKPKRTLMKVLMEKFIDCPKNETFVIFKSTYHGR